MFGLPMLSFKLFMLISSKDVIKRRLSSLDQDGLWCKWSLLWDNVKKNDVIRMLQRENSLWSGHMATYWMRFLILISVLLFPSLVMRSKFILKPWKFHMILYNIFFSALFSFGCKWRQPVKRWLGTLNQNVWPRIDRIICIHILAGGEKACLFVRVKYALIRGERTHLFWALWTIIPLEYIFIHILFQRLRIYIYIVGFYVAPPYLHNVFIPGAKCVLS